MPLLRLLILVICCSPLLRAASDFAPAARLLVFGSADVPLVSCPSNDPAAILQDYRAQLAQHPDWQSQVAIRATTDAFGTISPLAPTPASALTYTELLQHHLAGLSLESADYEAIIVRAYRFVINRAPYAEEIAYWRAQPAPLTYVLLVACIEDWARRNQPGLMVTNGTATVSPQCEFLQTARLAPAEATAARSACGLPPADPADDHHVIAVGAAHLSAAAGMHFVAVGAP